MSPACSSTSASSAAAAADPPSVSIEEGLTSGCEILTHPLHRSESRHREHHLPLWSTSTRSKGEGPDPDGWRISGDTMENSSLGITYQRESGH